MSDITWNFTISVERSDNLGVIMDVKLEGIKDADVKADGYPEHFKLLASRLDNILASGEFDYDEIEVETE